jgi:hypothetical protein
MIIELTTLKNLDFHLPNVLFFGLLAGGKRANFLVLIPWRVVEI